MSYCVNCGVQLGESEKSCPLCGVSVQNPRRPFDPEAPRPYPQLAEHFSSRNERRHAAALFTVLLLLPAVICFAVNIIYNETVSWSLYVAGSSLMLWFFIVPLYLLEKSRLLFAAILDALALTGFLWLCATLTGGSWFVPLALPITGMLLAGVIFLALLAARKLMHRIYLGAVASLLTGAFLVGLEVVVDAYTTGAVRLDWSLYLIPAVVLIAALFALVARKRRIKEELRRRLHL